MDNNQTYVSAPASTGYDKKKLLIGGVLLLVVASIVAILIGLSSRDKYEPRFLGDPSLEVTRNFGYIMGNDLYAYNGLAFYKQNLTDNKTTILNSGVKLPAPDKVYWADSEGVMATFSHSFTSSIVEEALRSRGESQFSEGKYYTWYYGFADSSLTLVSKGPVHPNSVVYSPDKKGFFYTPDLLGLGDLEHEGADVAKSKLMFFDVSTKKNKTLSEDLNMLLVSSFSSCPTSGYEVCIVGREEDSPTIVKLLALKGDGSKETLLSTNGRLIPTNKPNLYITTTQPESEPVDEGVAEEEINYDEVPGRLTDLAAGTDNELNINIGDNTILAHFEDDGRFYIVDSALDTFGKKAAFSYWEGRVDNKGETLVSKVDMDVEDKFAGHRLGLPASHGDRGLGLFTLGDGRQVVFGSTESVSFPDTLGIDTRNNLLKDCDSLRHSVQHIDAENLTRIYFVDDQNVKSRIKKFSDCAVKHHSILFGNHYYFGTISPINERITSD